jgi:hypothetical protein
VTQGAVFADRRVTRAISKGLFYVKPSSNSPLNDQAPNLEDARGNLPRSSSHLTKKASRIDTESLEAEIETNEGGAWWRCRLELRLILGRS